MGDRKTAREVAFKLIFEYLFGGQYNDQTLADLSKEYSLDGEKKYVSKVYNGVIEKYDELCEIISKNAIGFSIDRIYKIDKAILLLAIYEIKYMKDIPYAVSINEAVELSKKYSTEKSAPFVNGILSKIKK